MTWHQVGKFQVAFNHSGVWIRKDSAEMMQLGFENFEKWLEMIWDKEF